MGGMKTYAFNQLNATNLKDIATIRYEPAQPAVWEDLARREIGDAGREALAPIVKKLRDFGLHLANEATVWSRAIYPLLALAERRGIFAFSLVPLSATFDDLEIRGEADGALAASVNAEPSRPYLVVVEAKRGIGATEPVSQLLGALLCAAQKNQREGGSGDEVYGVYTIADVWTFVRARIDWSQPKPAMRVLVSGEYMEKVEAGTILAILESIIDRYADAGG
jgi:hypothetical protein